MVPVDVKAKGRLQSRHHGLWIGELGHQTLGVGGGARVGSHRDWSKVDAVGSKEGLELFEGRLFRFVGGAALGKKEDQRSSLHFVSFQVRRRKNLV